MVSEKITEENLSRVEESATKSTYKLGVGFERCEDKGEKSAPKFVPSSNYHQEEEALKHIKAHYPSNPKPSFNPKRSVKKNTPKLGEEVYICMFCGHAGHLDEFCFRYKRMEKRHVDYSRNSYHDEFIGFCLIFHLVLHLIFLMDLSIAHMALVHERAVLCLDALVSTHILIVVFVSHVGMVFPLEVSILTLSQVALMVHAFPVVVHIPLAQMVRCKIL
jgi:hypothetical protein